MLKQNLFSKGNLIELKDTINTNDEKQQLNNNNELISKLEKEEEDIQRFNVDRVLNDKDLQEAAERFSLTQVASISHSVNKNVVSVLQREFATVNTNIVDFVGSDDATTCIIIFMKIDNVVSCGHIDCSASIGCEGCAIVKMYESIIKEKEEKERNENLSVWIVGGFIDDKNFSGATLGMALAALNNLPCKVDLELVFSERVNNKKINNINHPIFFGSVYSKELNTVIPAHFTHLGPGIGLRSALSCCGPEEIFPCYDFKNDEICIDFPYGLFEHASTLLEVPDEFLLENVSTSGAQEPPRFLSTLKSGLKFLVDNPVYSAFFVNGPVRFTRSKETGAWMKK